MEPFNVAKLQLVGMIVVALFLIIVLPWLFYDRENPQGQLEKIRAETELAAQSCLLLKACSLGASECDVEGENWRPWRINPPKLEDYQKKYCQEPSDFLKELNTENFIGNPVEIQARNILNAANQKLGEARQVSLALEIELQKSEWELKTLKQLNVDETQQGDEDAKPPLPDADDDAGSNPEPQGGDAATGNAG